MNENRDDRIWCCFHPRELIIGVCALCLNERLLLLAASKENRHLQTNTNYSFTPKKVLPKIFALSTLLVKQRKSEAYLSSSTSQEDSFISIKFEDNGVASWDKEKISKMPLDRRLEVPWDASWDKEKNVKSVVEHAKSRAVLRWRKRIGHLFQVIRRKRSNKANVCHVGTKLEGGKVKSGWIRTLTKRRTKE